MNYKRIISGVTSLCLAVSTMTAFSISAADEKIMGDANADGRFNAADVVTMQKWLMGAGNMTAYDTVDFCADGIINTFDYTLMIKALRESGEPYNLPYSALTKNLCDEYTPSEITGAKADESFISGQTEFYLELMQKTTASEKTGENILISPYSVMQALAMTANGADSYTREEMENVLGGGMELEKLNEYLYTQRTSQPNNKDCKLTTANSIWTIDDEERIQVMPEFIQTNMDYFNADIFTAPFDDTTVKDINSWVNEKTDEMIPTLLEKIPAEAVMYLINAVAFDAKWEKQYTEYSVGSHDFTAFDGTVQQADMMYSTEYYYLEDDNAVGLYKYYEGRRYAFAAIMPDEGVELDDYIADLTPQELNAILANPVYEQIDAGIPKFSYDYEAKKMKDSLMEMGMASAFFPSGDFSRMAKTPMGDVYISEVIHKTFIDLCEAGTRAAAVTAVEMAGDSAMPVERKNVILDRPFLYCIVDTENDLPVFIGTLMTIPE